jgi:thiol:disulfide interchange protein
LVGIGGKQRSGKAVGRWTWLQLAVLALLVGVSPYTIAPGRAPTSIEDSVLDAKPFTEAALAAARATNKPVFLYFTADWCLTCKVNERVAIEREATRDAFAKAGVTVLRGDWTRRDPAITRFLSAQGVAGVPLYLWYPAGGGEAVQLPQLLGPDALVDLAKAARTN